MDNNSIISEARGECRHVDGFIAIRCPFLGFQCVKCNEQFKRKMKVTDYSDPSAWTPELYQWIESEGLWNTYLDYLCIATTGKSLDRGLDIEQLTAMLKATPAQKAEALSRAIQEVKG
jgi:hypothetical protein